MQRNSYDESNSDPSFKKLTFEERVYIKSQRLRLLSGVSAIGDRRSFLRPDATESILILYRITGDERLREEG